MADINNVIGRDVRNALLDIGDLRKDAGDAKNKAQNAETKAEEAKTESSSAKTKADSVQTQLDTVVVEGDSSVEAAQARVNAQGNAFGTLKERLDGSDEQLAQKASQERVSEVVDIFPSVLDSTNKKSQMNFKQVREFNLPDTDLATIGNPQGVAFDGQFLYISYRQRLYKYYTNGGFVADRDTTNDGSFGGGNGDCCHHQGFIYITTSNFSQGGIDGRVAKYRASDLAFIEQFVLVGGSHVPASITQKNGFFWVSRYTTPNMLLEKYSLDFSERIETYSLPTSQADGMVWIGDYLLINQHEDSSGNRKWGNCDVYFYKDNKFSKVDSIQKLDLWGQGIDYDIPSGTMFFAKRGYAKSKNKIILANLSQGRGTQSLFRGYLGTNQNNIQTSTWTKVDIDTVTVDVLDDFNLSTRKFVAPYTGYYEISLGVVWRNVVADKRYSATIAINDTFQQRPFGTDNKHSSFADFLSNHMSDVIFLNSGDRVEVYAKHEAGVNTVGISGNMQDTFLTIKRL